MRIGFIGLGKLGLPVAVCIDMKGHKVMGFDLDPTRMSKDPQPYQEAGPDGKRNFNHWLDKSNLSFGSVKEVCDHAEIIFVPVQTPHAAKYEGITRIPRTRVDFEYSYLKTAVSAIAEAVGDKHVILSVISTCLPGTMRREIMPLLHENTDLVYNPSLIAMGTTMRDFLDPEFIMIGTESLHAKETMIRFYETITGAPIRTMSIESCELTKVLYNTFISGKIAFANTVMELCQRIEQADCDEIMTTLKGAHRRLISPLYLDGGMGDGGGCHPRDNIAMSWLAKKHCLSFDLFDAEMKCREAQTDWLASILIRYAANHQLSVTILGYAFKPETNLTVGSPALLLQSILKEHHIEATLLDGHVKETDQNICLTKAVYLIGCKHANYAMISFPEGSVVIDPHRYIPDQKGVEVIRLGERKKTTQDDVETTCPLNHTQSGI